MILDRDAEWAALDRLLADVREGSSRVLVLRGDPGIGTTTLLERAVTAAPDMRVARVVGVESERELTFAALHQLLLPFLASFDQLPAPQREALGAAFGLLAGSAPNRFLVGLAALTLLTEAAVERPVLCVVDDAHWLDLASLEALAFVARRLSADRVGMLFGVENEEERAGGLHGLPELRLEGLPEDAASRLLAEIAGTQPDPVVSRRIVAWTLGNPRAVVELGRELSADELSGATPLASPPRVGESLEQMFLRRARALPGPTQVLLLLAAAEPSGDPGLLWRAAEQLGVDKEAADTPELVRTLRLEPRMTFRHPLVRAAVYHSASERARRDAHRALSAATDPELDPDRHAWHLASAARWPDELTAAKLERSADRARGRDGWAGRAEFLERAVQLTPDPARRARRLLAAAEARLTAGDPTAAELLLEQATPRLEGSLMIARARRLLGNIRFTERPAEAAVILLDAFGMVRRLDVRLARDTLLEALQGAALASTLATDANLADVLRAIRDAPSVDDSHATAGDYFLEGFALLAEGEDEAGVRRLRRATDLYSAQEAVNNEVRGLLRVPYGTLAQLLDDGMWYAVISRGVEEARKAGALGLLPPALARLALCEIVAGRFAAAETALVEAKELASTIGIPDALTRCSGVESLAWRGREAEAREAAAALIRDSTERGLRAIVHLVHHALTVLELGLGNFAAALQPALDAYRENVLLMPNALPDLIEAATRCGEPDLATSVLDRLARRAAASGTDWALGLLYRSQALVAGDVDSELLYRRAIEHLGRCRIEPDLARAHLLYGEWLRRRRRRRDAREQLRTAYEIFDRLGIEAFAERARVELFATGQRARPPNVEARAELTPQELQVGLLASQGASNQEIASQLFISTNTVAYHLTKVFHKLEVSRRTALAHALKELEVTGGVALFSSRNRAIGGPTRRRAGAPPSIT